MNCGAHASVVYLFNDSPTKEELIQLALLHRSRFTCGKTRHLLSHRAMKVRSRLQMKLEAKKAEM